MRHRLTDEERQRIRELFPDYSCTEIAEMMGLSVHTVNQYQWRYKLKHNQECEERLKRKRNAMREKKIDKSETYAKTAESGQRTRKREMFRLLSGERQKTKLQISILPKRMRSNMYYMVWKFHYFRDEDINKSVLYYDGETERNLKAEAYSTAKYGIKFIQADE